MFRAHASHRRPRLHLFDDTGMPQELRQSLYWGIWSVTIGMLSTLVTTGAAWSGFQRLVLGADDFQLGLIAATPVAANVLQIAISYLMEKKRNRRFLFLFFGLVGRFMWIPIGLIPFIFPAFSHDLRIWTAIVFVVMVSCGNGFVNLGYCSLMGDLVPMRIRGRYFSSRQRISLLAGVLAGLFISWMIDTLGMTGYTVALVLAGLLGMGDIACYFFVSWPPMAEPEQREDKPESLFQMIRDVFRNKPFLKVVIFYTCWHFSMNVAAPYYNVFLLEEMRFSFTQITVFTSILSNVTTVLIVSRWGRAIDRFGNKPMLRIFCVFSCLAPLPYVFAQRGSALLVMLSSVTSGLFWPVVDLCQTNLYLNQSPRYHRSMYVAVYFACINLLGVALGNYVGGVLMKGPLAAIGQGQIVLLGLPLSNYRLVFLLTTILRFIVFFFLLPILREEGSAKWTEALATMLRDTRESFRRRVYLARVWLTRRRARKRRANTPQP